MALNNPSISVTKRGPGNLWPNIRVGGKSESDVEYVRNIFSVIIIFFRRKISGRFGWMMLLDLFACKAVNFCLGHLLCSRNLSRQWKSDTTKDGDGDVVEFRTFIVQNVFLHTNVYIHLKLDYFTYILLLSMMFFFPKSSRRILTIV